MRLQYSKHEIYRKKLVRFIQYFFVLVFSLSSNADELVINKVVGEKEALIHSILKLTVSKVSPGTTVRELDKTIPIARVEQQTAAGQLDLMWAGSSKDLDERLEAVRIPLLKGLLGHRIFIIRKGNQHLFDKVHTKEDLAQYRAGMRPSWGSTKVLQQAGLPVVTSIKYDSLFLMVHGKRFEYFPRAVHEPWGEVAARSHLDLEVESRLLLIYPYAMYFYVRKGNDALHKTLTNGLEMAIKDGSFDKLFYSSPMIQSAIKHTNFNDRVVIKLPNKELHPDTPLERPELWLDVSVLGADKIDSQVFHNTSQ